MTASAVVAAFEARLAEWSSKDACPIVPENVQGETPVDGDAFMMIQFPVVARDQLTFGTPGTNVFREEGACRLVLHVQRGSGLVQGRAWADELVALFIGRDIGAVIVRAIDGPMTDDRNEDGMYYRLSLAIAYQYDFHA